MGTISNQSNMGIIGSMRMFGCWDEFAIKRWSFFRSLVIDMVHPTMPFWRNKRWIRIMNISIFNPTMLAKWKLNILRKNR